jgi:hypothetical protein
MAVVKTLQPHLGRWYCLLTDADADTIEVITDAGFVSDFSGEGDVDFAAAYFAEAESPELGPIMLRLDEATDTPVGFLLEHASRRVRHRWSRRAVSPLALIEKMVELAQALEEPAEPLPDLPPEYAKRQNGGPSFQRLTG